MKVKQYDSVPSAV